MIEECLVVEFRVTGDDCPLADATRAVDGAIDARPPQRRTDGNALLRFSAGESGDLTGTLDADDRVRYLHATRTDDRIDYRCLSKQPCVIHDLTDAGFLAESLQYRDGTERYTGAVVGRGVLGGVLDTAGETVGVTVIRLHPLGAEDDGTGVRRWGMTTAQQTALRAALEQGYFSVPRDATAGEVAATLDISKSAFLERLRRGQATLFERLFPREV